MEDIEYWDLGCGNKVIRMSDKSLADIMRALITTNGAMLSSAEQNGHYKTRNLNTVCFRIKLPKGKQVEFERLTGYPLGKPLNVSGG